MNSRLLWPACALVVGSALGYAVGISRISSRGEERDAVAAWTPAGVDHAAASSGGADHSESTSSAKATARERSADARTLTVASAIDELLEDFSSKRSKKMAEGLSLDDIQIALRHLESKKKSWEVQEVREQLMRAWARTEPDAAWKAAAAIKDSEDRTSELAAVAGEIAKTNPDRALQLAMALGMDRSRSRVLGGVFSDWCKTNPLAMVQYLNSHPNLPVDDYVAANALGGDGNKKPEATAGLALALISPSMRKAALSSVFGSWMRSDEASAMKWLASVQDPKTRDEILSGSIYQIAWRNPERAMELALQVGGQEARRNALQNALSNWMQNDPAAALDYITQHPSPDWDPNNMWALGYGLRNLTPEEQSAVLARVPEGKMKTNAVSQLASTQVSRGMYAQAVELLNGLPDSEERDHSLYNLGDNWGRKDGSALSQWLNQQPDSSDRDLVVAGYCLSLASANPNGALQWAAAIPDKKVQNTTYKNIALRWFKTDANAAQAWMNSTNLLSDADKKAIVTSSDREIYSYTPKVSERR